MRSDSSKPPDFAEAKMLAEPQIPKPRSFLIWAKSSCRAISRPYEKQFGRGRNAVLLANYVFVLLRDCSEVYLPHSFLGQESAADVAVEPFF